MEALITQSAKLLKGKAQKFREQLKTDIELFMSACLATRYEAALLQEMYAAGDICSEVLLKWQHTVFARGENIHRGAVAHVINLHAEIHAKRPANRPKNSPTSFLVAGDEEVLRRVFEKVAIELVDEQGTRSHGSTIEAANEHLRDVIRGALLDGTLETRGDDANNPISSSSIDTHAKRLRAKLKKMAEEADINSEGLPTLTPK